MTVTGISANRLELLQIADAVAREKSIEKEIVIEAIEEAIQKAARSRYGADHDIRVHIDPKTGETRIMRYVTVVDDSAAIPAPVDPDADPEAEAPAEFNTYANRRLTDALVTDKDAVVGKVYEEELPPFEFGRVQTQMARQVVTGKVREAERERQYEEFKDRVGEIVNGVAKRVEYGNVIVDLGRGEGIMRRDQSIPREMFQIGDRVRAYIYDVRRETKGPQIMLSRAHGGFMAKLFAQEVPEVYDGVIEIRAIARDPGSRAKMAVISNDSSIDPVGACVGMRGSRVQAVSNEIAGERVDIIPFEDNAAQFVINAMQPAEVTSIVVDEDSHSMDIAVAEEKLSQAIGRGGQNIRLASELTGWKLNIMSEQQAEEKSEAETTLLRDMFMKALDVDADVSTILVQEGFSTIEEIAYVPTKELLAIEEFDDAIVAELRTRARDVLLTQAIASEEGSEGGLPAEDLLSLEGMDEALAKTLAARGIRTRDDLADQAVEDLEGIDHLDDARAGKLIMAARAHWFEEGAASP